VQITAHDKTLLNVFKRILASDGDWIKVGNHSITIDGSFPLSIEESSVLKHEIEGR